MAFMLRIYSSFHSVMRNFITATATDHNHNITVHLQDKGKYADKEFSLRMNQSKKPNQSNKYF